MFWRRTGLGGVLAWVIVPRAYQDKLASLLVYDPSPFSSTYNYAIIHDSKWMPREVRDVRAFGQLEESPYRRDLAIIGDRNGDGRLDITDTEVVLSTYGGNVCVHLGDKSGAFNNRHAEGMWGGPELGFITGGYE